jgi:hypothetical protein
MPDLPPAARWPLTADVHMKLGGGACSQLLMGGVGWVWVGWGGERLPLLLHGIDSGYKAPAAQLSQRLGKSRVPLAPGALQSMCLIY